MFERLSKKRQEEGFTLIELLIVIVILGILAAVVVFAVGGISDRGKKAACKSDLKSVEVATEAYYAKSTSTPPAYPAATNATPTDDNTERLQVLVDADLLKSLPETTNGYTITLGAGGATSSTPDCNTL